jgi:hypothetical protein
MPKTLTINDDSHKIIVDIQKEIKDDYNVRVNLSDIIGTIIECANTERDKIKEKLHFKLK